MLSLLSLRPPLSTRPLVSMRALSSVCALSSMCPPHHLFMLCPLCTCQHAPPYANPYVLKSTWIWSPFQIIVSHALHMSKGPLLSSNPFHILKFDPYLLLPFFRPCSTPCLSSCCFPLSKRRQTFATFSRVDGREEIGSTLCLLCSNGVPLSPLGSRGLAVASVLEILPGQTNMRPVWRRLQCTNTVSV